MYIIDSMKSQTVTCLAVLVQVTKSKRKTVPLS